MKFRIGFGYDIHRLVEGRKCILGGVEIPSPKGLDGHSDADCLTHAICDALLGAVGLRDIGHFFPNTDPVWKDADSQDLLKRVIRELEERAFRPVNIDSTIIAEAPKIGPHMDAMKRTLSRSLFLDQGAIGIKATTNETVGAIGKGEAIAAHAVCLVTSGPRP